MIVGDEAHHQGLHGHESRLALLPVAVAGHAFISPLDLPIDYVVWLGTHSQHQPTSANSTCQQLTRPPTNQNQTTAGRVAPACCRPVNDDPVKIFGRRFLHTREKKGKEAGAELTMLCVTQRKQLTILINTKICRCFQAIEDVRSASTEGGG
jgi:hypothetical protein